MSLSPAGAQQGAAEHAEIREGTKVLCDSLLRSGAHRGCWVSEKLEASFPLGGDTCSPAHLLTCSPAREILSQWCHSPAPNPRFSRILFITRIFFLFYPPQGNSSTQRQVLWCSEVSYWLWCPLPILESWVEHQLTSIFLKFFVLIFFFITFYNTSV